MRKSLPGALMLVAIALAARGEAQPAPAAPGQTYTLSGEMKGAYENLQQMLAEAAAKMPEEHYTFKPTPEIKPYGRLVAHTALAQFRTCAMLKGEESPRKEEKEDATRTRAESMRLLKASADYCAPLVNGLTDAAAIELAKLGADGRNQGARGLLPVALLSHGMEMYGTMAVYLRLKGVVPPTTERQNQKTKK